MVHFQVPRVCLWLINMCCHSNGFHTDGGLRHIFRSHEFPRAWLINMCRHSNGFHTDGGLRHIFRPHEFLWLWLFTPPLKKKCWCLSELTSRKNRMPSQRGNSSQSGGLTGGAMLSGLETRE